MINRRHALAMAASLPFAGLAPHLYAQTPPPATVAPAASGPPSVDEFLREPVLLGASMSPNGRNLAVLREVRDSGGRVAYVALTDLSNRQAAPRRVVLGDIDVQDINWANDDRLLISLRQARSLDYVPTGSFISQTYDTSIRRLVSIGLDGQSMAMMFGERSRFQRTNFDLAMVVDYLANDPAHILMQAFDPEHGVWALYKVDVATGESALHEMGAVNTATWSCNNGVPVLRWDTNNRGTVWTLLGRSPGATEWTRLRQIRRDEFQRMDFEFIATTDDPETVLAAGMGPDDDAAVVRKFNLRTLQAGEIVSSRPGRDVQGIVLDRQGRLFAIRYVEDRSDYSFVDGAFAAHFRGLNTATRNAFDIRLIEVSADANRLLLSLSGPTLPLAFAYYDRTSRAFEEIGVAQPWLTPQRLAPMELLDVPLDGGQTMRAYLTCPSVPGPRPLVVMPHGGPESRDLVQFDLFAQAFAAQGWMVLQPNFRGSGGYGAAFADAGRRHWADLMQSDIEAAVDQVLATGRVNRDKVAIWGASYGGYAALSGGLRRPGLYKAVVSVAGVSDLPEFLRFERTEDGEDSPVYQYWLRTIGDPTADAAALAAGSPARRAEGFSAPVLLLHGVEDGIVPRSQSRLMATALRRAGKVCEHHEIPRAGHRNWSKETWKTMLDMSIAFLAPRLA